MRKNNVPCKGNPIEVYDINLNLLLVFSNAKMGAKNLNLKYGSIYRCLNNKQKSHKGYIFKYVDKEKI